jgi:hypothetical protein
MFDAAAEILMAAAANGTFDSHGIVHDMNSQHNAAR